MLRRALGEDLPRLVEIWMGMMREHERFDARLVLTSNAASSYQNYLMMHIRSPKSIVVVAEEEGLIAGFCCAYMCANLPMFQPPEFGYISDLAVDGACQRQGLGSQILDYVTEWFSRYAIRCIQLQVYSNNEPGKQFWSSKGYKPFVERRWLGLS